MAQAYSLDFRRRVVELSDEGDETAEACEAMGCCPSWARRLKQRRRELGTAEPARPKRRGRRAYDAADERTTRELIEAKPDATLAEVVAAVGKAAHVCTARRTLERLGLPRGKKPTHASEQDRPDVAAARRAWFARLLGVRLADFVFLGEFGAATNMTRTHGRAPRGQRVVAKVPRGHRKAVRTIAAMTVAGVVASASFDGATDTDLFVAFVREALVPVLRAGRVVVTDNLGPHKAPRVRALIEGAGARLLLLPPYSPDFNPIGMAISKVRTYLRKLARRTVDGLLDGITEALRQVTATDAAHYMEHCGYPLR